MRHGAYLAESGFYMSNAEKLDEIFDNLVKVRTEIAHKLGFRNFTELAYLRRTRNCYDPEMVANFRRQVVKDIVPIVVELKKKQAERIGMKPEEMRIYDDNFNFAEGNPKPLGTPDDIMADGKKMYEEMSPETAEFINFMYSNELLDLVAKDGKAVGGYCTEFPEYKAPFIFSNFNGTSGDVDVLTHEAGHAFAYYTARNFEFSENISPTMESCECHSMSMEFLAWKWLHLFYGDDTDRAKYVHLGSALIFLPYGCMVDHFQHIVYEKPEMTPAERHAVWKELLGVYMPWMKLDGEIPFYSEGMGWQRQHHIYSSPFYYIDYCLAQTVALEFWAMIRKDVGNAWQHYMAYTVQGGSRTFTDLLKNAGLESPFDEACLRGVCAEAEKALADFDLTGIE